ncbi:MAG: hypothetical protein ACAI43_25210 [Phycisphaerae bacterium]|nr:hypothetical protein [Tepidisphaeraceae bacterium]
MTDHTRFDGIEDRVLGRLRAEAADFDPDLPAGVRRRVMSALAALDAVGAEPAGRPVSWAWWSAVGGLAAAVVVALTLLGGPGTTPGGPGTPDKVAVAPEAGGGLETGGFVGTPIALLQEWVEAPLEGELENLMTDVTRATGTLRSVLPAPAKGL